MTDVKPTPTIYRKGAIERGETMNSQTILMALQEAQFTRTLKQAHLEKLASMAFEVTYREGEILYGEGDLGDVIYIIEQGHVAVETHLPDQGRVTMLTIGPGQLLGWSAFFPDKRKTAGSRALTNVRAVAISTPQLREACQHDYEFGYAIAVRIADLIAERLKSTRTRLIDTFALTRT
ncbi:MAG: cyclic nucleotide-binding domain-containing protein [Anaerolineae bacterium]|nr:cyclic nucleotide-binding domain-containing protein [Anaerolineae bacterium]